MNLLLSSTTVWNPGDDIIRFGCLAILEHALAPEPLHISLYDRNPRIQKQSTDHHNNQANVLCEDDTVEGYDLIVIAGTPDWGIANQSLYERAAALDIPIIFLGIGSANLAHTISQTDAATLATLSRAKLITCRDLNTADYLTSLDLPHHHLPCPATLASYYRVGTRCAASDFPRPNTTAIVTSDVSHLQAAAVQRYQELLEESKTTANSPSLICHSSHERNRLVRAGHRPLYDHDPLRLLQLLLRHQHLISGRLHAALPFLGAGHGRTAEILPNVGGRITDAWHTTTAYLQRHTPQDLLTTYTTLIQEALA